MENDKIKETSNPPEYTILKEQLEERFNKLNEIVKLIQSDLNKQLPEVKQLQVNNP